MFIKSICKKADLAEGIFKKNMKKNIKKTCRNEKNISILQTEI